MTKHCALLLQLENAELRSENMKLREQVAMWRDRYESLLRDAQTSEEHFDREMQRGAL
jgi:FtsZ-binding cell division protein ZapB